MTLRARGQLANPDPVVFCNNEGVVGYLEARPQGFVRGTPIFNRLEALTLVTRELEGDLTRRHRADLRCLDDGNGAFVDIGNNEAFSYFR